MTLNWVEDGGNYFVCEHETGEWQIYSHEPYYWSIDFTPAMEEGETYQSLSEKIRNAGQVTSPCDLDYDNAKRYGQRRIASAPTKEFAMALIERIINNDVGDGVKGELAKHGIPLEKKSSNWICHKTGPFTSYYQTYAIPVHNEGRKNAKGNLEGVIHPYYFKVSYVGYKSTRWWTFLSASTGICEQNGTLLRKIYWPKSVTDIEAILTKFALEELVEYSKTKRFR